MKRTWVNGTEYTGLFTPTGYTVSYTKRRGPNAGVMLDGSYRDDVRAIKSVITCVCMPTDENMLAQFLTEIRNSYVTLKYFEPALKDYREIQAMPSEPAQKYRGQGANQLEYWTGTVIQFEEC